MHTLTHGDIQVSELEKTNLKVIPFELYVGPPIFVCVKHFLELKN